MKIAFLGNFQVDYCSEVHHAKSLEALGHEVHRIQEPQPSSETVYDVAVGCDLFVWVHTHGWTTTGMDRLLIELRQRGIPTLTYHLDLWMGLQRQRDMMSDPYWQIEHFFTCDRLMADHLNEKTPVRGHYVPAGVFGEECYLADQHDHPFGNDVIFTGQYHYHPEWPYRPQLIDWLHSTYGDRFTRIAGDTPAGTVRGHQLNYLYASSKVVVGDSLNIGFKYPDYWSDRVYEVMGRGGFLIMPRIQGLERSFDDAIHLRYYDFGDFDQLKYLIDYYLDHDVEREAIRRAGHEEVKAKHTYVHRWQQILDTL